MNISKKIKTLKKITSDLEHEMNSHYFSMHSHKYYVKSGVLYSSPSYEKRVGHITTKGNIELHKKHKRSKRVKSSNSGSNLGSNSGTNSGMKSSNNRNMSRRINLNKNKNKNSSNNEPVMHATNEEELVEPILGEELPVESSFESPLVKSSFESSPVESSFDSSSLNSSLGEETPPEEIEEIKKIEPETSSENESVGSVSNVDNSITEKTTTEM